MGKPAEMAGGVSPQIRDASIPIVADTIASDVRVEAEAVEAEFFVDGEGVAAGGVLEESVYDMCDGLFVKVRVL